MMKLPLLCKNHFPFGLLLLGRQGQSGNYRFGYLGQEKYGEVKREDNSVNYKYRMHDPRIGRFFVVAPLAPQYPHNSPYAFSENVVIHAVGLEGLEADVLYAISPKDQVFIASETAVIYKDHHIWDEIDGPEDNGHWRVYKGGKLIAEYPSSWDPIQNKPEWFDNPKEIESQSRIPAAIYDVDGNVTFK